MNSPVPRIALTPGEPAGIGPDICVLIAQKEFPCELVAVADADLLTDRAENLGLPLALSEIDSSSPIEAHRPGSLNLMSVRTRATVNYGELNPENALYVIKTISRATKACINGRFHALVTGPIHKGIINKAGVPFSGHTEYLATLTGGYPVMMLTTPGLRVALATTHLPLHEVSLR